VFATGGGGAGAVAWVGGAGGNGATAVCVTIVGGCVVGSVGGAVGGGGVRADREGLVVAIGAWEELEEVVASSVGVVAEDVIVTTWRPVATA
jgi:hypothetical protein